MPTAAQYTDPFLQTYTPVPVAGPGVCAICHSGPRPGQAVCYSCTDVMQQVTRPTNIVVPISLYKLSSQLWYVLRYYKDGSGHSANQFAMQVAAIIARFTAQHLPCVARVLGGEPTVVTSVPSTRASPRLGTHPLETAVTRVGVLASRYAPLLMRGSAYVDHNRADDEAFTVRRTLSGARVLVVDDTLTTGARLQSAVSAIRQSGASAVAGLVVGRVIDPDWNDSCRLIWDQARATPFSFDTCCLCRS